MKYIPSMDTKLEQEEAKKVNEVQNQLFETQSNPTIKHVQPGDWIEIIESDEITGEKKPVSYLVLAVYPYIAYARHGSRHRYFNYGDLVQMGLEV